MLFGTNMGAWSSVSQSVNGMTACRAYCTASQNVPATWPGSAPVPPGSVPVLSFKPDLASVLNGSLDTALENYFKSAPPGAFVTAWAEGNLPSIKFPGSPYQLAALHAYLHGVAKQVNPGLKFGGIYGTYRVYTSGQDLRPFICPGLDFYMFDGYQGNASQTPDTIFGEAYRQLHSVTDWPAFGIAETNSSVSQAPWLAASFGWAKSQGAMAYMPFFSSADGYPFSTASADTISALCTIASEAAQP